MVVRIEIELASLPQTGKHLHLDRVELMFLMDIGLSRFECVFHVYVAVELWCTYEMMVETSALSEVTSV